MVLNDQEGTRVNKYIASSGYCSRREADKLIEDAISDMSSGSTHVFKGDYVGVDPNDPNDTYNLNDEYVENKERSAPTFHYVLKDVITVI